MIINKYFGKEGHIYAKVSLHLFQPLNFPHTLAMVRAVDHNFSVEVLECDIGNAKCADVVERLNSLETELIGD